MTIMGESQQTGENTDTGTPTPPAAESPETQESKKEEPKEGIFSDGNLPKDSVVDTGVEEKDPAEDVSLGPKTKSITITPDEKAAFIDAVVNNTRFTKDYSLFGGRVKLTLRSMTVDEVNALASWTAKQGTSDPAGLMSGRYRKYLAAAQIARYNGVDMPPLEQPLFETLGKDGKTVNQPGWIERSRYWDEISIGAFNAIMACMSDFDLRYATLCKEADNSNFWDPDTP